MVTRPERIVDKNGKETTVHKKIDDDVKQSSRLGNIQVPPVVKVDAVDGWPSLETVERLSHRISEKPDDESVYFMWGRDAEAIWAKTLNVMPDQVFVLGDGNPIVRINDTNILIDEYREFRGVSDEAVEAMIDSSSIDDIEKYERMMGKPYGRSFGYDAETIANASSFLLSRYADRSDGDDPENIETLKAFTNVAFNVEYEDRVPLVIIREDDRLLIAAVQGEDVFLISSQNQATITTKDFLRDSLTNETAELLFNRHVSNGSDIYSEHIDEILKA